MNEHPDDALDQVLADINDGVARLLKDAPKRLPTDYRGQFQGMANEVGNLSARLQELEHKMLRPSSVTNWEQSLAAYSAETKSLKEEVHSHIEISKKQSLWNKTGRLVLASLVGLFLGFLVSDPVLPTLNKLGIVSLGQITSDNCERMGGDLQHNDQQLYCVRWLN